MIMALSSVHRSLLSATLATGTVFAAVVSPFALHRSQVIELTIQNQPVLSTDLKSLSGPYLGFSGFISTVIGFSVLGLGGWRSAAHKVRTLENQVSSLQQDVLIHRSELERIKFSEKQLQERHLNTFVDPDSEERLQPDSMRTYPDVAHIASIPAKNEGYSKANPRYRNHLPPAEKTEASDEQLEQLLKQVQVLSAQLEQIQTTQSGRLIA
jgi:hypothetical protein